MRSGTPSTRPHRSPRPQTAARIPDPPHPGGCPGGEPHARSIHGNLRPRTRPHHRCAGVCPSPRSRRGLDYFMQGMADNAAMFERLRFDDAICRGLHGDGLVMMYLARGKWRAGDEFTPRYRVRDRATWPRRPQRRALEAVPARIVARCRPQRLSEQHPLFQESLDRCVERRDCLRLPPAVPFAFVDVVLVRHAARP